MGRDNLPDFVRIADALRTEADELIEDMENHIGELRVMLAAKAKELRGLEKQAEGQPLTNADHIRAMTDDKLAGYINYLCDCGFRCPCFEKCNEEDATSDDIYTDNYIPCTKKIYDWLKQEVTE